MITKNRLTNCGRIKEPHVMVAWGKWPINWLNKLGPHSKFAEIFITECELRAILGLC
jgi:hypothetical protein